MLAGEPVTGAAESGLDLVRDEDDAVLPAVLGQPGQEAVRRHDEAALTQDRLDDDRGCPVLAHLRVNEARHYVERLGRASGRAAGPAERIGHGSAVDLAGEPAEP